MNSRNFALLKLTGNALTGILAGRNHDDQKMGDADAVGKLAVIYAKSTLAALEGDVPPAPAPKPTPPPIPKTPLAESVAERIDAGAST